MTTSKKDQEKPATAPKKPTGASAEINKGKAELSDDDLKKVTGGAARGKTFTLIE